MLSFLSSPSTSPSKFARISHFSCKTRLERRSFSSPSRYLHCYYSMMFCSSLMISEPSHVFCSPTVCEKTSIVTRPSLLPPKARTFCISARKKAAVFDSKLSQVCRTGRKFSRAVRTDAQAALFDYLHVTRGLHSTDAEQISNNCPHFLKDLLSKVDSRQDVSRALSKYFQYNPINEFEPFLESLGLNSCEISSLLPRSLMYLEDDRLMFDNCHVLCSYGIPRIKIGKMYKEAKEIFGYEYGMLAMKLEAFQELGLSKSTVIKLVTCCPSLLIEGVYNKFVVVHEKMKGFGYRSEWINDFVSEKTPVNWNRMVDIMGFLMPVGYGEKQMEILLKKNPVLLFHGEHIYVLVGRLLKLGLKINQIYDLFLKNPRILLPESAENLWTSVCFLFGIGMEVEAIAGIVTTHVEVLCSHSLKRHITIIKSMKIQKDILCQVTEKDPLRLFKLASKSENKGTSRQYSNTTVLERRNFLLRLGYVENSDELAKALKEFNGRGDRLQERFDCLVQAGIGYQTVSRMVKKHPCLLNLSKDMLEKKIAYVKNCLGYSMDSIVVYPQYFTCSLRRIKLRFSMYLWLQERGKLKPMLSLGYILSSTDDIFVRRFVKIHPEGEAMWESLKNSLASG